MTEAIDHPLAIRRNTGTDNGVIEQWNKLPETVVNVNSVNTFKNKLDTFLKAKEGN